MSGRNGFDYKQPIYLNLAPNYDMTLMPRWMSQRGLMLDTEFRYLYEGGRGTVNASYMPDDDLRDRDRGRFLFSGYHNVNPNWQARATLGWVSDERYVEDFANRLAGISASYLQSTAGIYGMGQYWTAGAMAEHFQLTDYTLTDDNLPYSRLPRVYVNWEQPLGHWFDAGVWAEAVRFQHSEKPGGSRLDLKPYVSARLGGPAWYATPTLAWRFTGYQLDQDLADQQDGERNPTRSLPVASVAASRERQTTFWVGDTWKALECLLQERPDLQISVIPCHPSGLVVVQNLDPASPALSSRLDALSARYLPLAYPYEPGVLPQHYPIVANTEAHVARLLASAAGAAARAGSP